MSVLDLIDGAVEAWETSPDAMRWAPDRPAPSTAASGGWWIDPEMLQYATVTGETHRWTPDNREAFYRPVLNTVPRPADALPDVAGWIAEHLGLDLPEWQRAVLDRLVITTGPIRMETLRSDDGESYTIRAVQPVSFQVRP